MTGPMTYLLTDASSVPGLSNKYRKTGSNASENCRCCRGSEARNRRRFGLASGLAEIVIEIKFMHLGRVGVHGKTEILRAARRRNSLFERDRLQVRVQNNGTGHCARIAFAVTTVTEKIGLGYRRAGPIENIEGPDV